jgi:hypothetical protein
MAASCNQNLLTPSNSMQIPCMGRSMRGGAAGGRHADVSMQTLDGSWAAATHPLRLRWTLGWSYTNLYTCVCMVISVISVISVILGMV